MSAEQFRAEGQARRQAIRDCHLCDDHGWFKGADGFAVEPLRKCAHGEPSIYGWR